MLRKCRQFRYKDCRKSRTTYEKLYQPLQWLVVFQEVLACSSATTGNINRHETCKLAQ